MAADAQSNRVGSTSTSNSGISSRVKISSAASPAAAPVVVNDDHDQDNANDSNNSNRDNTNIPDTIIRQQHQQQQQVLLLRQCIYAAQGISDGTHILFYNISHNNNNNNNNEIGATTTTTTTTTSSVVSLENVLVNCPFNQSLLSSTNVPYPNITTTSDETEEMPSPPPPLPSHNHTLLQQQQLPFCSIVNTDGMMMCGTLGIYVRYIQRFVHCHVNNDNKSSSSIVRAFRIAVQNELQSYLQYVSNLTTSVGMAATELQPSINAVSSSQQQQLQQQCTVTSIHELLYRIYPYLLRFKTLVMIIDSCVRIDVMDMPQRISVATTATTGKNTITLQQEQLVGVNLLSHLYRHLQHQHQSNNTNHINSTEATRSGRQPPLQPAVVVGQQQQLPLLVPNLLRAAIQPWFRMLYHWIMDGGIFTVASESGSNNTTTEWFITGTNGNSNNNNNVDRHNQFATNHRYLWQSNYTIQTKYIPHIGLFDTRDNHDYHHNVATIQEYNTARKSSSSRNNSNDLMDLIFIIGKGVNYIRYCLQDSSWSLLVQLTTVEDTPKPHQGVAVSKATRRAVATVGCGDLEEGSNIEEFGFTYESIIQEQQQQYAIGSSTSKLRATLERSAIVVHQHILSYLRTQFHLHQHLRVLKQFMLFGQGDVYTSFIESIQTEYPSKQRRTTGMIGIYRHTLANIFETSIKCTNAVYNFPTHILERLEIELLLDKDDDANYMLAPPKTTMAANEKSENGNTSTNPRTVWDTLVLKYTIPDPIVAIVHDDAMDIYRSLFVQLLNINSIEYRLQTTWRHSSSIYRSLCKNAQHLAIPISTNPDYQTAIHLLRTLSITRQAMTQFMTSFKGYIMSEVVDCEWHQLVRRVDKARTLDEVIAAHDTYLQNIVRQSLLPLATSTSDQITGGNDQITDQIRTVLQVLNEFCSAQELLFDDTFMSIDRAEKKRRTAEQLTKQGSWGFQREREATEQETCFGLSTTSKSKDFKDLSDQFRVLVASLLQSMELRLNGSKKLFHEENATKTPSRSTDSKYINVDEMDDEEDINVDSLRFFASQLNYNLFYGVTNI